MCVGCDGSVSPGDSGLILHHPMWKDLPLTYGLLSVPVEGGGTTVLRQCSGCSEFETFGGSDVPFVKVIRGVR